MKKYVFVYLDYEGKQWEKLVIAKSLDKAKQHLTERTDVEEIISYKVSELF